MRTGPGCSNPVRSSRELASSLKGGNSQLLPAAEARAFAEYISSIWLFLSHQNITRLPLWGDILLNESILIGERNICIEFERDENECPTTAPRDIFAKLNPHVRSTLRYTTILYQICGVCGVCVRLDNWWLHVRTVSDGYVSGFKFSEYNKCLKVLRIRRVY